MSTPKTNRFNNYDCWTIGNFFLPVTAQRFILFVDCDHNNNFHNKEIIDFLKDFSEKNVSYVFNIKIYKTEKGFHILSYFGYQEDKEFCYNYILNMICDNPDLKTNNSPLQYKKLNRIRTGYKYCHCCNPTVIICDKPKLIFEYYPTPFYNEQLDLDNQNNFKKAFTYFTQNPTHKNYVLYKQV